MEVAKEPLIPRESSGDKSNYSTKSIILSTFVLCLVVFNLVSLYQGLVLQVFSKPTCARHDGSVPNKRITNSTERIDVAFFGKFAFRNMKIVRGIARTVGSILKHTQNPIHLHVLLDLPSKNRVGRTLRKVCRHFRRKLNVTYYDVEDMADQYRDIVSTMKQYFFSKDVGRYNDDIFFMSEIFHLALPFEKVIFLDVDLKFVADIRDLFNEFDNFEPDNVMGIGPDLQPQYRADFKLFREENPGTSVGSARPGYQGFNTGVVLFHLQRMRRSRLYNSLLNNTAVDKLCKKYKFDGYLGHQDFFTLTGMEYPNLYYHLNCTWNRQLDTGWRKSVGNLVFESYHTCPGKINIYHGNGDALIP